MKEPPEGAPSASSAGGASGSQVVSVGWGWGVYAAGCPLMYLIVRLAQRRATRFRADAGLGRRQRARRSALGALAEAAESHRDDPHALPRAVQRSLLDYVADRCNLPAGGMTRQGAAAALAERGVADELAGEFDEVVGLCEMAGYAGVGRPDPDGLLRRAGECVNVLEKARL